jgi:outer membrane lipoprotein-sorting protein
MAGVPKLSRRARWAVPVGALVVTGAVMAGSLISVAQALPGLPPRTPAQLLVQAGDSVTPPLTGTVVETASFGLPSLPGTSDPTSVASLLTGSHTVKVWYASPRHFRLAVPAPLSETDLIADGSTAWEWESSANTVTEYTLPPHSTAPVTAPTTAPLTPQQAAQQVLAAVGKTTTVSTDSNVTVAGQPAYELVLAPKDSRSLVGQVQIAIDGHNGVPLRLQVYARGASSPAFQVGYTSIQFATPAAADLTFSPPPGATVTKVNLGSQQQPSGPRPDISTIGSGWLAVLDLPSAGLTTPAGTGSGPATGSSGGSLSPSDTAGDSGAALNALLQSARPVSGAWGSGRLLQTSLVSVLITNGGRVFAGAVQPSVLYAAASQAGSPGQP